MTDAEAAAVISSFLADPLSPVSAEQAKQILQFAEESPDHEVVVDAKYMPWLGTPNPPEGSELLLAAFLAGNLKAQIDKKSNKPEPYAGVLAVINVYNKIKESTKDAKAGFHLAPSKIGYRWRNREGYGRKSRRNEFSKSLKIRFLHR